MKIMQLNKRFPTKKKRDRNLFMQSKLHNGTLNYENAQKKIKCTHTSWMEAADLRKLKTCYANNVQKYLKFQASVSHTNRHTPLLSLFPL